VTAIDGPFTAAVKELAMPTTPLHAALGVLGGELGIELVRQACGAALAERDDLEWKQRLPLTLGADKETGRDVEQEELAKDIAAMANSRGGLIVYGVTERPGTSEAERIDSVGEIDNVTFQNIRRVASGLICPQLLGCSSRD
jgi:hypothetical protein